ncbi:MAG: 3-keto-5-aminohexanoate cleavage protein [Pseudomonadota bacterium]
MTDRKTIITCAVTGSAETVGKNPAVPVTPKQIAQECIGAAKAGAAVVHIHVRDPETGAPSTDLELYRETVDRIRQDETDIVINLTTGYGQRLHLQDDNIRTPGPRTNLMSAEERIAHVVELRPEICSLDVATMNSGGVFGDTVMLNAPSQLNLMADAIQEAGTKPELEVFDVGHIRLARHMIDSGRIGRPAFFQMALGVDWGAPADAETIAYMKRFVPDDAHWAAFGVSRRSLPMATFSFLLGGHVRVGLEDNLYLKRGVLAPSNASLVEQAVQTVTLHGGEIATPQEARDILELRGAKAP